MTDAGAAADDWACARRRRWSVSRLAAAAALNLLVLASLELAVDRVELPRHGSDRSTTLVTVALHAAPPPRTMPLSRRPPPAGARTAGRSPVRADAPTLPPSPPIKESPPITLAAPSPSVAAPPVAAAASAPPADLKFLDDEATRRAIREVARGDTLASQGNALTHEEPGSELVAADGSHVGMKRDLPRPPPAAALAQGIDAAHKGDCMKGDYIGGGMGLLSAPFLLAAEALGKCAHKL